MPYNLLYNPLSEIENKYSQRRMIVWRTVNLMMTVFFILASLANVNDSDWYVWVPIYLLPAISSLVVVIKPTILENVLWGSIIAMILAIFIGYCFYLIAVLLQTLNQNSSWQNPLIHEEGRELMGMVIIIFWLTMSRFTNIGRSECDTNKRNLMNGLMIMTITLAVLPIAAWSVCFIGDNHKHIGHCSGMFKS